MKKSETEEKKQHGSKLIPYSYYEGDIPRGFPGVQMHWHSEFEINYILSGSGEFICGDEKFVANAGDIVILPPNMLHAINPYEKENQIYHTLVFSPDMLGASENDRCTVEYISPFVNEQFGLNVHISGEHPAYGEMKKIVDSLFDCVKKNTAQYDLLVKSELLRLFWLMSVHGDIYRKKAAENSQSENIRPVLEYINENFRENITIEQLAEHVHLSKSYFMNRFREVTGIGAMEYVIRKRIKCACDMLINYRITVAEIAFECGFRNISNFNRQFGKIVGCTPIQFRKMNGKKACQGHSIPWMEPE